MGLIGLCMIGYIANSFTVNMFNFPKIVGYPGGTSKDIVVEVSDIVRQKYIVRKFAINRCCF